MFGLNLLSMLHNYDIRKVGRDDFRWGFISTCRVTDGRKDYETAVEHKDYNGGAIVIVECYDTEQQAEDGHKRWVRTMTAKKLPQTLKDCANTEIAQLCKAVGSEMEFKRKAKKRKAA